MTLTFRSAVAAFALLGATAVLPAFAQDAQPASEAAPAINIDTPSFLKAAPGANAFEIQSSELAQQKSQDPAIKDFAAMVIADHRKAGEMLKATLASESKPAPDETLAPKQARMIEQLKAADGTSFDALYVDMQMQAHREAVALFGTYAGSGDDRALVGFAKQTLPALETHLHHVMQIGMAR